LGIIHLFRKNKVLACRVLAAILIASILAQAILLVLLLGLSHGTISLPAAIIIQSVDPLLLLLLPWLADRKWPHAQPPTLLRPHRPNTPRQGDPHDRKRTARRDIA
jgi:hypothetical protein